MAQDRQTLMMELRQIILADRQASEVIRRAKDTRDMIEADSAKRQAEILEEAEKRKDEMVRQVQSEQAATLAERTRKAEEALEAQRKQLNETMEKNRDAWIDQIVARVTAGE